MSPLDLSLPEAPQRPPRHGWLTWINVLVSLATLALVVIVWRNNDSSSASGGTGPDPERLEALATKLEKRTLYGGAAEAWKEYLAVAELAEADRAETVYRRGVCLLKSGDHAAAARVLSEVDSLPLSKERKREARVQLLECMTALGKNEVRESLSKSFAILGAEEEGTAVATIGREQITREEIREEIVLAVEDMLKRQGSALPPLELKAQAQALASQQLENPQAAQQAIQQTVTQRLLYREGLERGIADSADIARDVVRFRRQAVVARVLDAEREGVLKSISDTDVENHYKANSEKFVAPAATEFSLARFPTAEVASAALANPESIPFEKAPAPVRRGQPLPGIGHSPELSAHVLALAQGEVSDRPMAHGGAFLLFRADSVTPERPETLNECRDRVRAELAESKTREAFETLQQYLSHKYQVKLLDASLESDTDGAGSDSAGQVPGGTSGGGTPSGAGSSATNVQDPNRASSPHDASTAPKNQ